MQRSKSTTQEPEQYPELIISTTPGWRTQAATLQASSGRLNPFNRLDLIVFNSASRAPGTPIKEPSGSDLPPIKDFEKNFQGIDAGL